MELQRSAMMELQRSAKKMKYEAIILPREIMTEILSRLPIKPVVKCQLVCKEWQALILSYHFMKKHMERSSSTCLLEVMATMWNNRSFSYDRVFDGLIVLRDEVLDEYMVWNPTTRRVLELPDYPLDGCYGLTLSVAPATGSYKVVSFFKDKESALLGCRVMTLGGKALEWRQLTIPFTYLVVADACVGVVPLASAVHFAVRVKHGEEYFVEIITLDVETESFTLTRLPTGVFRDLLRVFVLAWNGKVALYEIGIEQIEVVVLEDYKKQKWCKEKEVIPLAFMKHEWFQRKPIQALALLGEEGEIFFRLVDDTIFTYVIETQKIYGWFAFFSKLSRSSFVTFKGMQPDERLRGFTRFRYIKLE